MKLKIILLIIIDLFTLSGIAQNKYLPIPYFWGWEKVKEIEKCFKNKTNKSLLYTKNDDNYNTILIILKNQEIIYWHIYNDSIISNGHLNTDSIFLYNNYKKTGAIVKEKLPSDTFIPPIISGSECVAYKDNKGTFFYFEYGKFKDSHEELPERKKYREEWLEIIRKELKPILGSE